MHKILSFIILHFNDVSQQILYIVINASVTHEILKLACVSQMSCSAPSVRMID